MQTNSQAPHSIQIAWFTSGITRPFLKGTMFTAFVWQCSEQALHTVPFVYVMQFSFMKFDLPVWTRCLAVVLILSIAPVAFIFNHFGSGNSRRYPARVVGFD